MRHVQRRIERGFSLVETALATAIVGIAMVGLMASVGSSTRTNSAGQRLTTATFLVQEVREWTLKMDFDALATMMPAGGAAVVYSPPVDGQGQPIADMVGWSQSLTISYRSPGNLGQQAPGPTDVICVSVTVSYQSSPVKSATWLAARKG